MAKIRLSTGYVVEFNKRTTARQTDDYEHLLNAIIGEHLAILREELERVKDKKLLKERGWELFYAGVAEEIDYILEHEIADHKQFLRSVLLIDCGRALASVIPKEPAARRKKPVASKQEKTKGRKA